MTKEELIERVNEFLVEEFEVDGDAISPEANLQETLDLDSLDYVDLVVVIESNFGFKVVGEDFVDIKTFADFYDYAYQKVLDKEAGIDSKVEAEATAEAAATEGEDNTGGETA